MITDTRTRTDIAAAPLTAAEVGLGATLAALALLYVAAALLV